MAPATHLHIRGELRANMTYTPRRGRETLRPLRLLASDRAYQLVLLDKDGRVLTRAPVQVADVCAARADESRSHLRASVPLHPAAVAYAIYREDIVLHRGAIPAQPPNIASCHVSETPDGSSITWPVQADPDLEYAVVAENDSGSRVTLMRRIKTSRAVVDLKHAAIQGKGRILVVVSDGVRSSEVEALRFDRPERAPSAAILSPAAGTGLPFGQPLSLIGCCLDARGAPIAPTSAIWSIDGEPRADGLVASVAVADGFHKLKLSCNVAGRIVESEISLSVPPPTEAHKRWAEEFGTPIEPSGDGGQTGYRGRK